MSGIVLTTTDNNPIAEGAYLNGIITGMINRRIDADFFGWPEPEFVGVAIYPGLPYASRVVYTGDACEWDVATRDQGYREKWINHQVQSNEGSS